MIISAQTIKDVSSKILFAVDNNELSAVSETLELNVKDNILYLSTTNREYFVTVKLPVDSDQTFSATVNAMLFLKLMSQITTMDVEFSIVDTHLIVKANGTYKLPLIFNGTELAHLPEITINNPTVNMNIDSNILQSILQYNSKQLLVGTNLKPVQKLYYLDERGAITFTTGACVNAFNLEKPVKVLLNNRLVKLFKLFKNDDKVRMTLGYDAVADSSDIIQTKVRFEADTVCITAITGCDDSLLNSVPVGAIRGLAANEYPHTISINKDAFIQAINRLLLFTSGYGNKENLHPYSKFEFKSDQVVIWDNAGENKESVNYVDLTIPTNSPEDNVYEATIDLLELKTTLENCTEQYLTMAFGDSRSVVIARGCIKNIIPEIHSRS